MTNREIAQKIVNAVNWGELPPAVVQQRRILVNAITFELDKKDAEKKP